MVSFFATEWHSAVSTHDTSFTHSSPEGHRDSAVGNSAAVSILRTSPTRFRCNGGKVRCGLWSGTPEVLACPSSYGTSVQCPAFGSVSFQAKTQARNDREPIASQSQWALQSHKIASEPQNFCVGPAEKTCGYTIRSLGGKRHCQRLYTLESKEVFPILEENHYLAHCKLIAFVQSVWKWMQIGRAMKHPTVLLLNRERKPLVQSTWPRMGCSPRSGKLLGKFHFYA